MVEGGWCLEVFGVFVAGFFQFRVGQTELRTCGFLRVAGGSLGCWAGSGRDFSVFARVVLDFEWAL